MSSSDQKQLEQAVAPVVRTTQGIVAGLAMGPLVFAVIAIVVLADGPHDPADMLTKIPLVGGLAALLVQSIVGQMVATGGVKQWAADGGGDPAALAPVHQIKTIVTSAINEGAAFLCLVFYGVINPDPWLLAMAGLLIVANVTKFPTVSGVAHWCKVQARAAGEEGLL